MFSLLSSRKATLLIFPKVCWKHRRLGTHLAQIPIWTRPTPCFPSTPSIHHFSSFYLCSFFSFLTVSAEGKAIVVSDETEKSMKVTWRPAPGNVVNYRVTYKPQAGGRQLAAKVPGGTTTTVLRRLTSLTTYDITVLPVYRSGEGKARQGVGTTRTLIYHSAQMLHCVLQGLEKLYVSLND